MANENTEAFVSYNVNTLGTSIKEKMRYLNAVNSSVSLSSVGKQILKINALIMMDGVRKGRGGQPDRNCTNIYLLDVDGKSYFSQSDGVARAASAIATMFPDMGATTDMGYLPIQVTTQNLTNGNTMKSLDIVEVENDTIK